MESTVEMRAAAVAVAVAVVFRTATVAAQQASGVTAVMNSYVAMNINWDLRAVSAFCATWDADMPLEWRQRYGWAAFCGPAGAQGEPSCGRCLQVTNAFGIWTTVRIVDECSFGGLGLDPVVFLELDTDGHGQLAGYLTVSYEFIDCQD